MPRMDDLTAKYLGETVDVWIVGGETQQGLLTGYGLMAGMPHVELDGHILIPLQNVVGLHCTTRCDGTEPGWPPLTQSENDFDD